MHLFYNLQFTVAFNILLCLDAMDKMGPTATSIYGNLPKASGKVYMVIFRLQSPNFV